MWVAHLHELSVLARSHPSRKGITLALLCRSTVAYLGQRGMHIHAIALVRSGRVRRFIVESNAARATVTAHILAVSLGAFSALNVAGDCWRLLAHRGVLASASLCSVGSCAIRAQTLQFIDRLRDEGVLEGPLGRQAVIDFPLAAFLNR